MQRGAAIVARLRPGDRQGHAKPSWIIAATNPTVPQPALRAALRLAASPHRFRAALPALSLLACASLAAAQGSPSAPPPAAPTAPEPAPSAPAAQASAPALEPSRELQPLPRGEAARQLPIVLRARQISGQPGAQTVAEGEVEFRRGGVVIQADRLSYDVPGDLARAQGGVEILREGQHYRGTELQLQVERFEGYFLNPEFDFAQLGAGGSAERIDFFDSSRSRATRATYTSCPRDGPLPPDWVLSARSVHLDLDANEGIAEGAVLRFLGVPILALPTLSFPLSDARKSGWLPPSVSIDNRSGLQLSAPYYWNIAENLDATLAPRLITRRGLGLDGEFRYLQPSYEGTLQAEWLPDDRVAKRSRSAVQWGHEGRLPGGLNYSAELLQVSDHDWWKDFPDAGRSLTPRLLAQRAALERPFNAVGGEGLLYTRVQQWQVLQSLDAPMVAPYERSPQIGAQWRRERGGWSFSAEAEYNRFSLPAGEAARDGRPEGERAHLLAAMSHRWGDSGWWLMPRLSVNAASYSREGLRDPSASRRRVIPTFSLDGGLEFERETEAFGRALRQTLEPRLLYVNTPYRAQSHLPSYDAAGKDFNFVSIYTDNSFSGIDRVADSHQITGGVTTRLVDVASGAEVLRLALVQRHLLSPQRVAAQADGTPDGPALTQRLSDALLLGSTSVLPNWTLDAALQYSPDSKRTVRSIVGARYSPGPFRTVGATYRLARGLSEQLELGWQWPLMERRTLHADRRGCDGNWYTVGRVNYSLKDSRVTDSVLGLEYDAGCWIGRIVTERLSTGRREATTRLMLQLELVGLSRLGSNPLKVLRDNIPGYRLLREE